MDPAKGKTRKKLYFSPHRGDETTTYYNRAIRFYFVQGRVTAEDGYFISWSSKELADKYPGHRVSQCKNRGKRLCFHHAVEIKRPHPMTVPCPSFLGLFLSHGQYIRLFR